MSFVFWEDSSIEDLDDIWAWADPADYPAIGTAVAEIHDKLTRDPIGFSESRTGSLRVIIHDPLSATFFISSDGSRVEVVQVRLRGSP